LLCFHTTVRTIVSRHGVPSLCVYAASRATEKRPLPLRLCPCSPLQAAIGSPSSLTLGRAARREGACLRSRLVGAIRLIGGFLPSLTWAARERVQIARELSDHRPVGVGRRRRCAYALRLCDQFRLSPFCRLPSLHYESSRPLCFYLEFHQGGIRTGGFA
jgi:hypothetical protein